MATKTGLPTTKEEVLSLLINRKTPRGYNSLAEACSYLHTNNGGCAIGMCVSPLQAIKMEGNGNNSIETVCRAGFLPRRLKKLGIGFLEDVQNIHDYEGNWINEMTAEVGEDGLVWDTGGKETINRTIKYYKINIPLLKI